MNTNWQLRQPVFSGPQRAPQSQASASYHAPAAAGVRSAASWLNWMTAVPRGPARVLLGGDWMTH